MADESANQSPHPGTQCSEVIRTWSPVFNGSIFVGGGSETCSRDATMMVAVWFSKKKRPFCTFHGNRQLRKIVTYDQFTH